MEICTISELYPPEVVGGAEKHVRTVAERLVDRGHEVTVLTTGDSDRYGRTFTAETVEGVRVERIAPLNAYSPIEHPDQPGWKKPLQHAVDLWNPHPFLAVRRRLSELDPDVVHVHNFSGFSPSVFRAAAAVAPVCHTLHDYSLLHVVPNMYLFGETRELPRLMSPLRRWNRATVEPYVDVVTAPSNFLLEKHRSRGLFADTRCVTLRLGTDAAAADPAAKRPPTDGEPFRLLFVGNLSEKKGVSLLASAFDDLAARDVRLDIAGKGPERERIERAAAGHDHVHVHGFVPEERLDELYRRAHATVVPSTWYDNSPMVIYESYSNATPVLGADVGGIPELVDEGETGYVFEPGSRPALLRAVDRARESITRATFETVAAKNREFSLDGHVDGLLSVYDEAIVRTPRPRPN